MFSIWKIWTGDDCTNRRTMWFLYNPPPPKLSLRWFQSWINNGPQTTLILQVIHPLDKILTLNICGRIILSMNTFFSYIKYKLTLRGKKLLFTLIQLDSMVVQYNAPVLLISLLSFFPVVEMVVFPSEVVSLITKDVKSVADLTSKPLLLFPVFLTMFIKNEYYNKISNSVVIIQNQ